MNPRDVKNRTYVSPASQTFIILSPDGKRSWEGSQNEAWFFSRLGYVTGPKVV